MGLSQCEHATTDTTGSENEFDTAAEPLPFKWRLQEVPSGLMAWWQDTPLTFPTVIATVSPYPRRELVQAIFYSQRA